MGSVGQDRASDVPVLVLNRNWQVVAEGGNAMKSEPSDLSSLRAELALISPSCAYEERNPHTCPLRGIRDKSLKERVAWLDAESEEAIHNIYSFCRLCLAAKKI